MGIALKQRDNIIMVKYNFYNYLKKTRVYFIVGLAALVVLGLSSKSVSADTFGINFESPTYHIGSIDGQDGWSSLGSAGAGCAQYDHAVATNTYGYLSFGSQSLRISNAVTSGCFGDQTFSKSLANEAGESTAANGGLSGGTRQQHFEAQWDFASTVPGQEQPGLSVVASPDRGDGSRMSWIQMADEPGGLAVNFYDVQGTSNPANFVLTPIASGLDRTIPHTIKVTMDFVEGDSNDVVKVFVDGVLMHTGTSWENYYRYDSEAATPGISRTVDSMLFRTGGTAAPATLGNGFLIDNLSLSSGPIPVSTVLAQDTFVRSNQAFWGTASDGHVWGTDANSSNKFSINANRGQIANGNTNYSATLGPTVTDADVLFSGKMSDYDNTNLGSVLRFVDSNNWYKAYVDGDDLVIQKKVNGATSVLASVPFAAANNVDYSLRFHVAGSALSAKVWQSSAAEPVSWMATATDSTFSSGQAGLRSLLQGSITASYSSFLLTGTQISPIIAQDTFQRPNQSKWGTASDGLAWGADAATNAIFSISGNTGHVTGGSTTYTGTLGATATNAQILFSGSLSSFTNNNLGGVVRFTDANNWYKAYIDGSNLIIQKKVGGTATTLKTVPFAATAGVNYSIRFQVVGTALSAKVWATSASEPAGWTTTVTDSSLTSGFCGLRMQALSATAIYTSFLATSL